VITVAGLRDGVKTALTKDKDGLTSGCRKQLRKRERSVKEKIRMQKEG